MEVVGFVDEGLGHSSYLVDLGDGTALVVDPPRFPEAQERAARDRDLRIGWTADTHSHADYVSGSPELATRGACFLAPGAARLEAAHRPVDPGEDLTLAPGITLHAIPTPGHTPEHLAYLLVEDGAPVALFSGGSLMVGTVGRTDLLGPTQAEPLARDLYRALRDEILTLPDELAVYPTHGAGSFCSAPGASERTTTIGRERATNLVLAAPDEDSFVATLLAGFGTFPSYFSRLPELNRRGARLYGALPALARVTIDDAQRRLAHDALVVDARPIAAYAAGHVPGSLSVELRPVFASWLGWLVAADQPLLFVLDADQARAELVRQCLDVGCEHLLGELDGGIDAWIAAGLPVTQTAIVRADELRDVTVVDVRQRNEYTAGHVPGARNLELGSIADAAIPEGPVAVMCGHGERAMTAASVLERAGRPSPVVVIGGPEDWARATGRPLELDA